MSQYTYNSAMSIYMVIMKSTVNIDGTTNYNISKLEDGERYVCLFARMG